MKRVSSMSVSLIFAVLTVLVLLTSCNLSASTPTAPAPVGDTPAAQSTAAVSPSLIPPSTVPSLDEAKLNQGTYRLAVYGKEVILVDGKYEAGSEADYLMAILLPQMAFGDLDGDGVEDAAVLIGENGGGSGTFVSLYAVLNQSGIGVQSGTALIDDRPRIESIAIQDGEIIVNGLIHGAEDSMASPSLSVMQTFQLTPGGLTLMRFSSARGDAWGQIEISSPASGAKENGVVQVQGSMPIAPFENNLRLRVYDMAGNVLLEGPFTVQAEEIGGPATFDHPVDLSTIAAGTTVRLELSELSMRDGSVLTMDSVVIVVR